MKIKLNTIYSTNYKKFIILKSKYYYILIIQLFKNKNGFYRLKNTTTSTHNTLQDAKKMFLYELNDEKITSIKEF